MGAQLGPRNDPHRLDERDPELMRLVTGISPVAGGKHVLLEDAGFKAVQRLVLATLNGDVLAAFWPGELMSHARHLYSERRAERFVSAALEGGWRVDHTPHLAFFQAPAHQRLYLDPVINLAQYVELWEGPGWERIGGYSQEAARTSLWLWLKEQGCATAQDDEIFGEFLLLLGGKRQAHLRPGLRAERMWLREDVASRPASQVAADVRTEVNRVLGSIGEPRLPVG